jgi:hypothetical protein
LFFNKIEKVTIISYYIAILNDYTRYQEEPGNAYPEALPPYSGPRLFLAYIGSQALPGS